MMKANKLVSVVIPSYNSGSFLHDAIRSVCSQTHQHTEIVVVDNGSSDNTSEVSASYPGVRLIRQMRRGVSAARNCGLRESHGGYVVFLDADDRLLPEALESGVSCLNSHPECAFASGHVRLVSKDGSVLRIPDESCIEKDHYLTLLQYCYIWTPSAVMFRRSVIESMGGFASGLSGAADWDLYLRIARRWAVFCHAHLVADYRVHDANMSGNHAMMLIDSLAALRAQREWVKGHKGYDDAYRLGVKGVKRYFGDPLYENIKAHVRASDWRQALCGLLVLLRYDTGGLVRRLEGLLINAGRKCKAWTARSINE
jgi:glycosyltransferase involved in cell wall biosynthesis